MFPITNFLIKVRARKRAKALFELRCFLFLLIASEINRLFEGLHLLKNSGNFAHASNTVASEQTKLHPAKHLVVTQR